MQTKGMFLPGTKDSQYVFIFMFKNVSKTYLAEKPYLIFQYLLEKSGVYGVLTFLHT